MTVGKDRADRGRRAVPGPGGRAAGVLRADRRSIPPKRLHRRWFANATSDDLKWGQLPLDPAARCGVLGDDRRRAVRCSAWRSRRRWPRLRRELQKLASRRRPQDPGQPLRRPGRRAGPRRQRRAWSASPTRPTQRSDIAGKDLNAILGPVGRQHLRSAGGRLGLRGDAAPRLRAAAAAASRRRRRAGLRAAAAAQLRPAPRSQLSRPRSRSTPPSLGFGGGGGGGRRWRRAEPSNLPLPGATKPPPGARRPRRSG